MKSGGLFLFSLLVLWPPNSFGQEQNFWGDSFGCAIVWFGGCRSDTAIREKEMERSRGARDTSLKDNPNLPVPVRNVLENPSPETARAYVLWSRKANEKLAKATEYITQATREMNEQGAFGDDPGKVSQFAGLGPVGLYYFFSPADQSAPKDVAVLNKIWREGQLGVVGIPVGGKDNEIVSFVNEAKPLFPIRRSDAEVKFIKPTETPLLYLALPLEKKLFRLGPTITETAITEAIGKIMAGLSDGKSTLSAIESK